MLNEDLPCSELLSKRLRWCPPHEGKHVNHELGLSSGVGVGDYSEAMACSTAGATLAQLEADNSSIPSRALLAIGIFLF